jgi:hypothetical protein
MPQIQCSFILSCCQQSIQVVICHSSAGTHETPSLVLAVPKAQFQPRSGLSFTQERQLACHFLLPVRPSCSRSVLSAQPLANPFPWRNASLTFSRSQTLRVTRSFLSNRVSFLLSTLNCHQASSAWLLLVKRSSRFGLR